MAALTSMQKIVDPRPGMISEVISLAQHAIANLRRGVSVGIFQHPLDAFHPKLGGSLPALDHSLGNQKQLVSRFKRQYRRFVGHVSKESQRHSATFQNMRALRI